VLWFAKSLCVLKIARFSAATAVPSKLSLHTRAKLEALADVLFGKGHGAILGLLCEHPVCSFYYRQLLANLAA
jgi:hypothetical protein